MKIQWSVLIGISIILFCIGGAYGQRNEAPGHQRFHQHSDGDLDVVQCHHSFYRVNQNGGKPELVSGQESRSNPSRQYLPPLPPAAPPANPPSEEAPAASFDQPNLLPVEKALVSPGLQKSFNSLFGKSVRPELAPAEAQNIPANALAPAAPKTVDKTSDDDDPKYSLDRLCKDAFHSFLCKPITGPRRTPNGRLRPNAVLPAEVLAGLSSSQDASRVRPDNNVGPKTPPSPVIPFPSNQNSQRIAFPPFPTTPKPTARPSPVPFSKPFIPYKPETPSPTYVNPQALRPEPSNEIPFQTAPQTNGYIYEKPSVPFPSQEPYPSNENPQLISTTKPLPPRPTQGYYYDKGRVPFPSNNVPQVAQPPQVPHNCNQHKNIVQPLIANPSNGNPTFERPTTKSFFTQKMYTFPTFSTQNIPRYTQPKTTTSPIKPHDCSSHRFYVNPFTNHTTTTVYTRPTSTPRVPNYEAPKVQSPTFNVPQIVAQPQQLNIFKTAANQQGYFYDKPPVPFPSPVGNPSNDSPFVSKPTQRPFTFQTTSKPTNGYAYDQPRVPFPSNNIAQIIISKPQPQQAVTTTTSPTSTPCHHANNGLPPVQSPTNQKSVVVSPEQTLNGYVYNMPREPFPPEVVNPSNEDLVSIRPFVTTTMKPTTGYFYEKPANPLLLPNQNTNVQNSVKPVNNGIDYKGYQSIQKQNGYPSNGNGVYQRPVNSGTTNPPPFEAITTSGYSNNKPKGPYPSSINEKLSEPSNEKLSFLPKPQNPVVGFSFTSHQSSNHDSQFKGYGR